MRTCIFCPNPANSKEDAWPLWLVRKLPTPHGVRVEGSRRGVRLAGWKALQHGIKVRFVCKACNNGWMSRLESQAKPIVERFFDEQRFSIAAEEQAVIATWMVKNAMVFEALRGHPSWFYTQSERDSFRISQTIPNRTTIWLAPCVDLPGSYCSSTDHAETERQGPEETRLYVTTMAFGRLALQAASVKAATRIPENVQITIDVIPGPWDYATTSIWPMASQTMVWPLRLGLAGELGLELFHTRWGKDNDRPAQAAV